MAGMESGEEKSGPCFAAVKEAQVRGRYSGMMSVYTPTCNNDGSFVALQCG